MHKLIANFLGIIICRREPNIGLIIGPNGERVESSSNNPLPDIKLPPLYNKGVLDILLRNPLGLLGPHVILYLNQVVVGGDASSSR